MMNNADLTLQTGEDYLFSRVKDPILRNHPYAPEVYHELKTQIGFFDDEIPSLMKKILSLYDEIKKIRFGHYTLPDDKALSASIIFVCLNQAVNLTKYHKIVKNKMLEKIKRKIGISVVHNAEEKKNNALERFKKYFELDEDDNRYKNFKSIFLKTYETDRKSSFFPVTLGYLSGLVYFSSRLTGLGLTQRNIAECFKPTIEPTVRKNYQGISERVSKRVLMIMSL